jgi:LacI family transcriptional regulator
MKKDLDVCNTVTAAAAVLPAAVTIRDVARESGVSIGTVSHVFNESTRHIRPETRQRVIDAARRLRYRPNGIARGLVQRRTRTLGILFHASSAIIVLDPYASAVLHGILLGTAPRGYSTLLFPQPLMQREKDLGLLADGRADGILIVAPDRADEAADMLAALGMPVGVISARRESKEGILSVDVDNERGGYLATEYLLSLGHRRIAHLTGNAASQKSAREREAGFRAAMAVAGVPVDEALVVPCGYHGGEAYEPVRRLLSLSDPPTALFCANDNLAVGALLAARDARVAVPAQLSVIGFDDAPAASLVTPPLSTIRQPLSEIGRRAAQSLIDRLEAGPEEALAPLASPIIFEPTLVVRGSTAPPTHA